MIASERFFNLSLLFCFYHPTLNFHYLGMNCNYNLLTGLPAFLFTVYRVANGFLKYRSDSVTLFLKPFDFSLNMK